MVFKSLTEVFNKASRIDREYMRSIIGDMVLMDPWDDDAEDEQYLALEDTEQTMVFVLEKKGLIKVCLTDARMDGQGYPVWWQRAIVDTNWIKYELRREK